VPRSRTVEEEDCEVRRGRGEGIIPVVESRGDGGPDEAGEGPARETERGTDE
jgi:hypothetical protein